MADSDEEYDKKIRDKFRAERDRSESYKGIDRRDERRAVRDEWIDRDPWRSRGRGDFRSVIRDRQSPARHDSGPPPKRIRSEWEDRRYYEPSNYSYGSWYSAESHVAAAAAASSRTPSVPMSSSSDQMSEHQPQMMSLRQFVNTLDDSISDDEALKKYNEYKLEFRKLQLNVFFMAHKNEEWFKEKYHPVLSKKRKETFHQNVKRRLEVFKEMLEKNRFDSVLIDSDHHDQLVKVMDMFVILLEGGTENDFKLLDPPVENNVKVTITNSMNENKNAVDDGSGSAKKSDTEKPGRIISVDITEDDDVNDQTVTTTQNDEKDEKTNDEKDEETKNKEDDDDKSAEASAVTKNGDKNDEFGKTKESDSNAVQDKEVFVPKPARSLHRTSSLFLKSLAPTITREDIINVCSEYPGFLRVALSDAQADRRWFRRGWVTFERDVDIKELCWNITNVRVNEMELNPNVNRDLTKRVRFVNQIVNNRRVLRNDMKLCAQLINKMDEKWQLWSNSSKSEGSSVTSTKNPVLKNITTYLIEESSAEEAELLGENEQPEEVDETDIAAFKVLDRMIFYLRFVHSIDYYNQCDYPFEDEMPNRCGLMHARTKSTASIKVTSDEVNEYCKTFRQKMLPLLEPPAQLTKEEIAQLGAKDPHIEVDKFIAANTLEMGPQKWKCSLSGKKFKGPEFVLKHIYNRHGEKVEEVRADVETFNNYLRDPKRPQLPEHPANKPKTESVPTPAPVSQSPYPYNYGGMYSGYGRGGYGGYTRGFNRGASYGGRGRGDQRPIIHYRDLDAPKEPEEFI